MKQGVTEPLRGYIQRFNVAALEAPSANVDVLSNAFAQGLIKDGKFFRSLAKKPPISFDNLLTRVEKYVNVEEATQIKRNKATPVNQDEEDAEVESEPSPDRPKAESNKYKMWERITSRN
ncbi:hypothetical protein BUALT_Bualt19G0058900 [Buddleja alternifolia]|uniref:Uncharacterized protein n=1 Tax=Buddleja alternifolia TaxID=168488 RepID=A0AAV6W2F3_9LAMI|nr:hypothetical protein BUALT_Bualt19G0058900 [Buddleja alternifolia]